MKKTLAALAFVLVALLAIGSQADASATMHNCPQEGKWEISVWTGDTTDAGEALGTCGNIEVAYALTPTGAWERYIVGAPEVNTLETIDQYQGVIALGGPVAPVVPKPTNVSVFGTLPDGCTINDLAIATQSGGQGHAHARTGLHTQPLQVKDGVATRTWTQFSVAVEVCFYCNGEFLQCADFPKASGDAHCYTVEVIVSGNEYEILPRQHEYMRFYLGTDSEGNPIYGRGMGGWIQPNPTCPTDDWRWEEARGLYCEGYPDAQWGAYRCGPDQEPLPDEEWCFWDR